MKKITLLLFALCLSLSAAAQIKLGVDAGMNLTHFKSSHDSKAKKIGGMGAGFQIGGTIDYEFNKNWTLMSGASFVQTKSNMEMNYYMLPFFKDAEIRLNHIMVPLKLGYNIRINDKISLIPYIGVYASYNFSAGKCDLKRTSGDNAAGTENVKWEPMKGYSYSVPVVGSDTSVNPSLDAFRRWTYGAVGGVKAVISNHYSVSLQYSEDIKKIQGQCGIRNYGLQLSVGYTF